MAKEKNPDGSAWRNFDEEYLSSIEKYRDSEYYQSLVSNPYLIGNNQPYTPTWTEKVKQSVFGDYSAMNAYYGNLMNLANIEKNKIIAMIEQNKYNEPVSQVQRESAAGINSALAGSAGANQAAENDTPSSPAAMFPSSSDEDAVSFISNISQNIVSGVMSFMNSVQDFKQKQLGLDMSSVGVQKSLNDLAWDEVLNRMPDTFSNNGEVNPDLTDEEFMGMLDTAFTTLGEDNSLSPRLRKRIRSIFNNFKGVDRQGRTTFKFSNARKELENRWLKLQKEGADIRSSSGFSFDIDTMVTNLINIITEPSQKMQDAFFRYNTALYNAKANYYSESHTPSGESIQGSDIGSEKKAYDKVSLNNSEALEKSYNEFVSDIESAFKEMSDATKAFKNKKGVTPDWVPIALMAINIGKVLVLSKASAMRTPPSLSFGF